MEETHRSSQFSVMKESKSKISSAVGKAETVSRKPGGYTATLQLWSLPSHQKLISIIKMF